ncbi:MAG: transcriptional regulator, partial [Rhodobacteraceae bacterium]|nr:transcriptional regulator [Paracoccaceae bacterium]
SFLILFVHYLVYLLLWKLLDGREAAADLTAILCVAGSLFALLSRYAVFFWKDGLHQPPSLSLDPETNIHNAYYIPLLIAIAGFVCLCILLILVRTRTGIVTHLHKARQVWS